MDEFKKKMNEKEIRFPTTPPPVAVAVDVFEYEQRKIKHLPVAPNRAQ